MAAFTPITTVDLETAPDAIVHALVPQQAGIVIDTASVAATHGASSIGWYDGSLAPLGIGSGLLLTSGTMPGTSNSVGFFGVSNGLAGDADLDAVVNRVFQTQSYDATSLSFDFEITDPSVTGVSFDIVFGSDEFPEWVNQFVDIAVVLVNGVNVAWFDKEGKAPLSVIGSNLAAGYFISNQDRHLPIEYDGISAPMTVFAPVHMGHNTVKIGVADTRDSIYDSGLFISNMRTTDLPIAGVRLDIDGTELEDLLHGGDASDYLQGYEGNDNLSGGAGDDVLSGGVGDDSLDGGAGDDWIEGGPGDDSVSYPGNAADYTVVGYTDGTVRITPVGLASDTDVLLNVEHVHFADQTLDLSTVAMTETPPAPLAGFNPGGTSGAGGLPAAVNASVFTGTGAVEDGQTVSIDLLADAGLAGAIASVAGSLASLPAGVSFDAASGLLSLDPSDAAWQDLSQDESHQITVLYGVEDAGGAVTTAAATFTLTGVNDAPQVSGAASFGVQEDLGVESVAPVSGEEEAEVELEPAEIEANDLAEKDSLAAGKLPNAIHLLSQALDVDHLDSLSVVDLPTVLPQGIKYIHMDAQVLVSSVYYGAPTVIPAIDALVIDPSDAAFQSLARDEVLTLTIDYGVSDGLVTTPASAVFTVTGTNDAPRVSGYLAAGTAEGGPVVLVDALSNASDVDHGAVLSLTAAPAGATEDFGGLAEVENPGDDTLHPLAVSADWDGSAASLPPGVQFDAAANTFALDGADPFFDQLSEGETGVVVVRYGVTDGLAPVATAGTAIFSITGANDAPVVSAPVALTLVEDASAPSEPAEFEALELESLEHQGVLMAQWPGSVNLLAHASDVDRLDTLSVIDVATPLPLGVSWVHALPYASVALDGSTHEHPTVDALVLDVRDAAFQSLAEGELWSQTIDYTVSDGRLAAQAQAVLTVIGTNDAPRIEQAAGVTADEDSGTVAVDALAGAVDVDHGAILTVVDVPAVLPAGITWDAAAGRFTLDASDPVWQELSQGEVHSIAVAYGVSDGMVTTPTVAQFRVVGVNDLPVITGPATGTPNEDGQVVEVHATENASDIDAHQGLQVTGVPDTLPAGVSYDPATQRFALDPSDPAYQQLSKGETLDVIVPYSLFDGVVEVPTSVIFTVTGRDDAPVVSGTVDAGAVAEGAPSLSIDLLGMTHDVDHLDSVSVLLGQGNDVLAGVSGAAWTFPLAFSVANNQVALAPSQFNALRAGESVTVNFSYLVGDGNKGNESPAAARITILGENDAPTSLGLSSSHVAENSAAGTVIGQFTAADADRGDTLSYAIVGGSGLFAINGDRLVVAPGATLDFEAQSSVALSVQVSDAAGASLVRSFSIALDNQSGITLSASSKADTVGANSAPATTLEEDSVDGKGGNDWIDGRAGNDTLVGGSGNDTLLGGLGDDQLTGTDGVDLVNGGEGNDRLFMGGTDAVGDTILGGTGTDTLVMTGNASLSLNGFHAGQASIEVLEGNGRGILGSGNADLFDFSALTGIISAGMGYLDGGNGNDTLIGSRFADVLRGGSGNDLITGGLGADSLTGGAGADTFRFDSGFSSDTITDFVGGTAAGHDMLDFSQSLFANYTAVQAAMSQSGSSVVIALGPDKLTLVGVSLASLSAADFAFH